MWAWSLSSARRIAISGAVSDANWVGGESHGLDGRKSTDRFGMVGEVRKVSEVKVYCHVEIARTTDKI
ncbi:hypothetical protein CV_2340 [Chromobacterium violaceum ATCC 12472]|uniref:Uncharacterized protein n=1 Tax=Chromobacterium violaceum (strain ATCC 12472 / DSM 30191 / JCM 1249 / CCUG 213 / NBRC 12614 / NCIMB 9131 / NCTC 9757 / MK) TaxID=243365 RepID=Q7NVK2_CHRVO|nr:hypothetical protein CV_2340 [Chromobacterium violaceum ATCC 12472]